jgi:hypothetical protein
MKRLGILPATMLVLAILAPTPLQAQNGISVTAAAGGIYPPATTFNGVRLDGLRFGTGITIATAGSAEGQFQATLLGTSLLGLSQNIAIEGKATIGSSVAAGTATFSGTCTMDMGDGSLPLVGIPFTAAIATNADDKGTITLSLATTNLPAATVNTGSMKIK